MQGEQTGVGNENLGVGDFVGTVDTNFFIKNETFVEV